MTYVLPQTPALAAEFQVRFTSLDTLGDERLITLSQMDLSEAIEMRDHIQTNQENYQLPVDAAIWWRTSEGPWQPWSALAAQDRQVTL